MSYDVVIIGAGPVGLCLAKALADESLSVAVVEQQEAEALAAPDFDGREIALTHASMRLLREIDVWQYVPPETVWPLRRARVLNGSSPHAMEIEGASASAGSLGCLVPNYSIRRAAWRAVQRTPGIALHTGAKITALGTDADGAWVQLADGTRLESPLLVAADSRYSQTRRSLGIVADLHDFGKSMLVCRMQHSVQHQHTAWEWFGQGQTLALLPLDEYRCSVVLTLPGEQIQHLLELPEDEFDRQIERRFEHRLGAMQLDSSRHAYPLVGVYARSFVGPRFALAGDAAVGMHPVTAHGFNLGLAGVERLVEAIDHGIQQGLEIGDPSTLSRYNRRHRRGTLPLYLTTRAIVELYTNDRGPARLLRTAALRAGSKLGLFKRAIASTLSDEGPLDAPLHTRLRKLWPA